VIHITVGSSDRGFGQEKEVESDCGNWLRFIFDGVGQLLVKQKGDVHGS
jgi:hypothetical protein